jgi:two-component system sensor histidine kinase/response regulator
MVVDDDPGAGKVVTWILKQNRYTVKFFDKPGEALEEFKKFPERYKGIVVDAHMPGMTGFEFARRIRKLRVEHRIILLTDFQIGKSEFKKVFPSSQINDILVKPTEPEQLLHAIAGTYRVGHISARDRLIHRYERAR